VGLEDIACKLLVGSQQKILKIAFEILRNKFHRVLTELVRLFDRFDKINHRLRFYRLPFYCIIAIIIAIKLYCMSLFKSGILLQQPIAPLEGVSAHVLNMYCTILKEMRGQEILDLPG